MPNKQMKLQELLRELAKKDTEISKPEVFGKYMSELQEIYEDDFRHLYSDVFGIITRIDDEEHEGLTILSRNIHILYKQVEDIRPANDSVFKKIAKLYDHVNLDIARIAYTRRIANELNEKHKDVRKQLEDIRVRAEYAQRDMQKNYITILGIFSSIVVTFVAGMAFSTSILGNIDKASIYRLIFIISLVGLGLFNLVNLLLRFIQRINSGYEIKNDENAKYIEQINTAIFIIILIDFIIWIIYWCRFS